MLMFNGYIDTSFSIESRSILRDRQWLDDAARGTRVRITEQ